MKTPLLVKFTDFDVEFGSGGIGIRLRRIPLDACVRTLCRAVRQAAVEGRTTHAEANDTQEHVMALGEAFQKIIMPRIDPAPDKRNL